METLPQEIILLLLNHLGYREWASISSVSHHLNRATSNSSLWDRYVFVLGIEGGPSQRVCHSCVLSQSKMFVYGGHNPEPGSNFIGDVKNELFQFDFISQKWSKVHGQNFPLRTEHSSVCSNGKLITFGGYSGFGGYKNDIAICDIENGFKWELIHPKGDFPTPRSAHSIVLYKNKVYVFGGWDGRNSNNNFYKFNLEKCMWKKVKSSGPVPEPRRSHAAVVVDDSMYVFGGYDGSKNVPPLLHRYDFKLKKWHIEETKGSPPCGRSRARLLHYYKTIAVFGGWDRVNHFQKWHEYNLDTNTWHERDVEFPSKGIGQHSAVVYNNSVYVFGGYNEADKGSSGLFWGYFLGHLGRENAMA